jgi:pimeloyl-ACP methyl ester carboxylesterase
MKYVMDRLVRLARLFARILGLCSIGSFALAGLVAFRHMLATPQPLDSLLPGEAHLYRWKHGHIYYKVAGKQHTPPMVLLHTPELDGSSYEMLGIMATLATHFRVYALDLLGFGLSDRPGIHYTTDIYTQLIHDFLTFVVKEPATLVGSRLSCNYAITVAANSPDLCARLALLSPTALYGYQAGAFGLPPVLPSVLPARIVIVKQAQMLIYPLLVAIARLSRRLRYGQPERLVMGSSATRPSNSTPDYNYATTHQFGAEHAPMAWLAGHLSSDVSGDIEKLRQPTLIIWGTGELQYARQGYDTAGSHGLDTGEISGATTRIVLLQHTASAVHEELPETVVKTILQWSVEPAIQEAKSSMLSAIDEVSNAPGTPDTAVNQTNGTVKPQIEAYCMKCKEKRVMLNAHEVMMKNGRSAVQGACSVCGTQLFRMGRLAPGYPQTPI